MEFFTGFEGCGSTGEALSLFDTTPFGGTLRLACSATGGYAGSKGVKCSYVGGGDDHLAFKYVTAGKTKVVGMHVVSPVTAYASTVNRYCLFRLRGTSMNFNVFNTSAGLVVANGTTVLGACSEVLTNPAHIEVKIFSDASAGTVQVKLNGTLVIDESSINTVGNDITSVMFGYLNSTTPVFDNIFIADDWQGQVVSKLLQPASDSSVQFTPSTGSDNYAMLDDQDGDTTYVESSTVGHTDLYGYEDLETGYLVKCVSVVTVAKKDDSGTRTLSVIARQDSTEYEQGEITLTEAYPSGQGAGSIITLGACPDATAWDRTKLNAITWGFEVAS